MHFSSCFFRGGGEVPGNKANIHITILCTIVAGVGLMLRLRWLRAQGQADTSDLIHAQWWA